MKKIFLMLMVFSSMVISCKTNQKISQSEDTMQGSWKLNYITGSRISFDGLYANNVPNITFDLKENRFSGSNSCNRISGSFTLDKNKISFDNDKIAMTMMACQGNGDQVFMSNLQKVDSYAITEYGKVLTFFMGDVALMRFEKMNTK